MSYEYQKERPFVFTEDGVNMLIHIRDKAKYLISEAGCCRMDKLVEKLSGSQWSMIACVDYLVERKELIELTNNNSWTQYRVFTDKLDGR